MANGDLKLESIVRPFQTRDISPPAVAPIAAGTTEDVKTVKFEWGKGKRNVPIIHVSEDITASNYMTKRQREQNFDPNFALKTDPATGETTYVQTGDVGLGDTYNQVGGGGDI